MKRLNLIVVFAFVLAACNNQPAVDTAKEQQALLDADKDFCSTEQSQGWKVAAEKYYDENVVAISPNQPVAVGKAGLMKSMSSVGMDTVKGLHWKAEKGVVSSSGDMGYTWGFYDLKTKTKDGIDTTYYGAYATVWKKTEAGWKAVVDQNNDTPKP